MDMHPKAKPSNVWMEEIKAMDNQTLVTAFRTAVRTISYEPSQLFKNQLKELEAEVLSRMKN